MAIPFAFPSDEDTEANYQRLDQLLSDLYVVLQQILMTQRRIRDAQPSQTAHRFRTGQPSNSRRTGEASDIPSISAPVFQPTETQTPRSSRLLDAEFASEVATTSASISDRTDLFRLGSSLVENTNTVSGDRSSSHRQRRRRRTSSCCDETKDSVTELATTTTTTIPDWTQVGVKLRKIADDFYASVGKDDSQVQVQAVTADAKRPCDPADASLLSMLVPPPFGGSIWTAVLFVVGWRLLARAR